MSELFAHEHQADHWVLVADQSRAKIFALSRNGGDIALTFLEKFDEPKARMHDGDLLADQAGESGTQISGGKGVALRAMESSVDPSEQEADRFAKDIAEHLEQALHQQKFTHLTLVAGPVAMGKIRNELSKNVLDAISAEHNKNLSQASTDDIVKALNS